MKINQFATNEVIFYHSIVTGDTIALELTQVTENIPKTVNPVVQVITDNWFKCEFTTVTGSTQENLTGGTIYCRYDGYYDYKLKRNGTTIEDSQFFMQGPAPIIIENQAQNTYIVTNPYAGSSGTSGQNGSSGVNGTAGSSGRSGTNGVDGIFYGTTGTSGSSGTSATAGVDGSSGSSGQNGTAGSAGSSGVNGTSGVNGSSGSSGQNGTSGASGSSGSSASSGASGSSGLSGSSGSSGVDGITAGRTYYFNQSQSSDVSPYKVVSTIPTGTAQQTVTKTLTNNQQNVLVQEFITGQLGFGVIPGGTQRFHMHFLKQASNDQIQTYVTIQLANSAGVGIGPILSSGNSEIGWVDAATPVEVTTDLTLSTTTIDPTNRMIVKIYTSNNDSTSHNVVWYTEGTSYYSFINTSVGASSSTSGTSGAAGSSGSSGRSGTNGVSGSSGSSGANGATGAAGTSGISGTAGTSYAAGFVQTRAGFLFSGSTYTTAAPYYAYQVTFGVAMPSANYAVTIGETDPTSPPSSIDSRWVRNKTASGFQFMAEDQIINDSTFEWMVVEYNTGTGGIAYGTSGSSGSAGSSGDGGLSQWTPITSSGITQYAESSFVRTNVGGAWNEGFYSQEGFEAAYVTAKPYLTIGTSRAYIGLDSNPSASLSWDNIDYAIGWSIGDIYIHENGVTKLEVTTVLGIVPTVNTKYAVIYDGYNVKYYVNDILVYTTPRAKTGLLYLDGAIYTGNSSVGWKNVVFGPMGTSDVADILGSRIGGLSMLSAGTTNVTNLKKNLFGRIPQTGNRMFLTDAGSPGNQTAFTVDATHGTLQWSWMPFIGGISSNKINTILPYKASTVTAETKFRIAFYMGASSTLFSELNAFYGTYVPNNFFQNGFPSINTYLNNIGSTVSYSAQNAQYSHYFPLPQTLIGYSAVITIAAGAGNQTIGHTQMYAADGSLGFYMPDGNVVMMIEMESTNATVGTFGRLSKIPVTTGIDTLNCSPNWSNLNSTFYGVNFNKANCLSGGSFKTVGQGGMSSYTPPATITIAELAAMFGGPGPAYNNSNAQAGLHTMVTFA